ncbi:MAG: polysaccharide biosynthesis protein [Clostridia bacterium]|nr:polysaccharide biosynthesis protein [Clostridia bacterium]
MTTDKGDEMGTNEKNNNLLGGSFVKMAAILAAAGLLVRVLGFLYRLPLTNMIGNRGNGIYSAGYYIYNFFLIMSSAGLPVAISKMISEKIAYGEYTNAKKIFKVSMLVSGGLSFLCALIMAIGTTLLRYYCETNNVTDSLWYRSTWCLYSLSPTIFIVGIMAVYRGYFQGFNTTVPTAVSQLIEQIFNAFFSVYLAWLLVGYGVEFGAAGGTMGTGIGALAGLFILVFYYIKSKKSRNAIYADDKRNYRIEGNREIALNLAKIAIPIITGTAIFSMTNFVDMAMVDSRLAAAGFDAKKIEDLYGQLTGKYVTLSTLPVSISTAVATAVIPSIAASMARKEHKIVQSKVDTALRVTMMISIPAAAGLGALGRQILEMLFPRYPEGGVLITVGSFSVIFLALSQISTGVLQGIGKVKTPAYNALWGALTKIPVNYVLIAIPQINVVGAVISTTVCYIVCSVLNFRALVKATGVKPDYVGMLVKPGISAAAMSAGAIGSYYGIFALVPSNTFAVLAAILIAMMVYLAAMILVKGFKKEDLKMMPAGTKLIGLLEKINRI